MLQLTNTLLPMLQAPGTTPANFLVGVAPVDMSLERSIGEAGCGIALDYYGYIYVDGKYFHVSNLANWQQVAKSCKGSTARHKGKAGPLFQFHEGKCEITITLDLKEGTLKFSSGGHSIGTIANVRGPLHAALTLTHYKQTAVLLAGGFELGVGLGRWVLLGEQKGMWHESAHFPSRLDCEAARRVLCSGLSSEVDCPSVSKLQCWAVCLDRNHMCFI
jgi:hypothetical protein